MKASDCRHGARGLLLLSVVGWYVEHVARVRDGLATAEGEAQAFARALGGAYSVAHSPSGVEHWVSVERETPEGIHDVGHAFKDGDVGGWESAWALEMRALASECSQPGKVWN